MRMFISDLPAVFVRSSDSLELEQSNLAAFADYLD